jgi:hypothetical protein
MLNELMKSNSSFKYCKIAKIMINWQQTTYFCSTFEVGYTKHVIWLNISNFVHNEICLYWNKKVGPLNFNISGVSCIWFRGGSLSGFWDIMTLPI